MNAVKQTGYVMCALKFLQSRDNVKVEGSGLWREVVFGARWAKSGIKKYQARAPYVSSINQEKNS